MKKKLQNGSLYYRQKDILRPVGAILLPAGLVMMWLGWSYISYIFATIAIPVGLVLFIVGSSKHISDNDMQEQLDHAMLDYDRSVTDMNGYERVVLRQPAPVEISAYHFGDKAAYFKKGKNGTPISDLYTRSHLFFTKDSLMIVSRTVSVTALSDAEDTAIADVSLHIPFSTTVSVALEEHNTTVTLTNTGKPLAVKWCELVIRDGEEELVRVPAKNDMDASALVSDVNRRCGR